jgi:polar amino acid transport system substrate-binding protein
MRKAGIALAGILIFAFFTGCAHTAGDVAMASASPVLDRIVERGEIRVGTAGTMPPLNMTTRDGEVIGLEPDIAALAADSMGVKLKLVTMPFSELLPSLEQGKIDMILSGMTVTLERNMKVAFVGPYMKSGKAFLSKIKTIASADDTTELNSPRIKLAALKGSTSQRFVEAVLPKASLVTISDYDQ